MNYFILNGFAFFNIDSITTANILSTANHFRCKKRKFLGCRESFTEIDVSAKSTWKWKEKIHTKKKMKMIDKWAIKLHYNLASIPLPRFIFRNWICGLVNLINANLIITSSGKKCNSNATVLKVQLKIVHFFPTPTKTFDSLFKIYSTSHLLLCFVHSFFLSRCYRFALWCMIPRTCVCVCMAWILQFSIVR